MYLGLKSKQIIEHVTFSGNLFLDCFGSDEIFVVIIFLLNLPADKIQEMLSFVPSLVKLNFILVDSLSLLFIYLEPSDQTTTVINKPSL